MTNAEIKLIMSEFNCEESTAKAALSLFGKEAANRMRINSYEDFCAVARKKPEFICRHDYPETVEFETFED